MTTTDEYESLEIHPILQPVKKFHEFLILGTAFVGNFEFQKALLGVHPDLTPFVDRYNEEVKLRIEGRSIKSNVLPYMNIFGRIMIIAVFDIVKASEFRDQLSGTDIYQFARHLRNGAAHDNKFRFDKSIEPVTWRDKVINQELQGTAVFPDFFNSMLIMLLASDISKLIIKK